MTHRSRRAWLAGAFALLGIGALAAWGWRATQRAATRAALPALPDLRSQPAELREQIAAAQAHADIAALSGLYHANGFLAEATRCYALLEKREPRNALWLHRHAAILAGFGDTEPASERWQRVVALAPDYIPARLRLAEARLKQNRPDEAAALYAEVLRRASGDPHAALGLARIDVDAERWDAARQKLEPLVARTNYALGYDLIVTVYEHLDLGAAAAEVRRRAKASGAYQDPPDPWLDALIDDCFDSYRLSLAAGVAARAGDTGTAVRRLQRAVALAPQDPAARLQLAGVLTQRGDVRAAREQLEACTTIAPAFADGWAHLAALLQGAGDAAGAERTIAAGLQRCPESPGLHLMRARQLRDAGRASEAIAAYRQSIRFRPNEADAYLELATTLFRLERVPEGLAELHRALGAEPEHPLALSLLALHAIGARHEEAARQWLRRVLDQPRVPREQVEQLLAAYREQFGRAFSRER